MFSMMMSGYQQEVRAVRAALIDERCKAQPDPQRIRELEACERRAMEALIAGQILWGPYWAFANIWFGGGSNARGPEPKPSDERPSAQRPFSPVLMAAE
jgi:hypothetical protein